MRHGVRSAVTPIVTILGIDLGVLLGGAILTETVFNIPGIGRVGLRRDRQRRPADDPGDGAVRGVLHHHPQHRRRHRVRVPRPAGALLSMAALLEVKDLRVHFDTPDGVVKAVDGISYAVDSRQGARHRRRVRLGQERLEPHRDGPHARRATRTSRARSCSRAATCSSCRDDELRQIRGNDIAMIFQDPLSSLHPFYKVGDQLVEAIRTHNDVSQAGGARSARSSCSGWSTSRSRARASTPTRTSSRAACASAR